MAEEDKGALSNIEQLPAGALRLLGGQQSVQQASELAQALRPAPKPIDPALLSFLYFSQMAAEASKPGATLLGSASSAASTPAAYLLKQAEEERKREEGLGALTVQLATLMKPPTGTGIGEEYKKTTPVTGDDGTIKRTAEGYPVYNYNVTDTAGNILRTVEMPDLSSASASKPITLYNQSGQGKLVTPGSEDYNAALAGTGEYIYTTKPDTSFKTVGSGTLAKYMSKADATQFVLSQGMDETNENFQTMVETLTAKSESQIGQPITDGGVFLEVVPLAKGGEVINLQLTPSKSAASPYFTTYVEKRLPIVAKSADTYNTTAREVLPRVDEALNLLLSGEVETGKLNQALLPFKQVFNQSFGITDPEVVGLETLQATSNFLAPKMRPVGSGSTSDMEFRAYQQAALYLGNTPEANYVSLYAFKKMAQNGVRLNQLEQELLTSGEYSNMRDVNSQLNTFDKGIFEKYSGDPNDEKEVLKWYDSLPKGAVFINNGIFDSKMPYIIKGWGE